MDLTAFIKARLDEDERTAKGLAGATRFMGGRPDFYGQGGPAADAYWDRFTPARALREVTFGRTILAQHGHSPHWQPGDDLLDCQLQKWPCPTLRALAAVWSGHPDYPLQ